MAIKLVSADDEPDFFEDFWDEYPRKVSKKMASKAWNRLRPDQKEAEQIILALYRCKKQWAQEETEIRFIPHASTWLNQERFNDPIEDLDATPDWMKELKKKGYK